MIGPERPRVFRRISLYTFLAPFSAVGLPVMTLAALDAVKPSSRGRRGDIMKGAVALASWEFFLPGYARSLEQQRVDETNGLARFPRSTRLRGVGALVGLGADLVLTPILIAKFGLTPHGFDLLNLLKAKWLTNTLEYVSMDGIQDSFEPLFKRRR